MSDTLGGWVFDTAAVVAYANGGTFVQAVLASCRSQGLTLLVPDTVLSAALNARPDSFDALVRLRRDPVVWLAELTEADDVALGRLLARTGGDIEVAHVVYEAARRGWPVLSGRARQLLEVDPALLVEPI